MDKKDFIDYTYEEEIYAVSNLIDSAKDYIAFIKRHYGDTFMWPDYIKKKYLSCLKDLNYANARLKLLTADDGKEYFVNNELKCMPLDYMQELYGASYDFFEEVL